MDPVAVVYYALVCAVLARTLPPGIRGHWRLALGAAVGAVSAAVLPVLRDALTGAV